MTDSFKHRINWTKKVEQHLDFEFRKMEIVPLFKKKQVRKVNTRFYKNDKWLNDLSNALINEWMKNGGMDKEMK